jgi:hypothetical protein
VRKLLTSYFRFYGVWKYVKYLNDANLNQDSIFCGEIQGRVATQDRYESGLSHQTGPESLLKLRWEKYMYPEVFPASVC